MIMKWENFPYWLCDNHYAYNPEDNTILKNNMIIGTYKQVGLYQDTFNHNLAIIEITITE